MTGRLPRRYRRQQWFGAKPFVKRVLAARSVHLFVRRLAPLVPGSLRYQRLPAPRYVRSVRASIGGINFEMLAPDRCVVAKELYWGKGRRPGPADQLALDVFAVLAVRAGLVLDIGAYTGIFALLAARRSAAAEVHAFEIVPEVAELLQENVVRNGLESRVRVHRYGIGLEGVALVPAASGGSALPDFFSIDMGVGAGRSVPVRSVDGLPFLSELGSSSGVLMKVDVEGAERDVLEGAQEFVGRHKPEVLCELLPGCRPLTGLPSLQGYHFYLVEDGLLREQARPFGHSHYRDWLFSMKSAEDLRLLGVSVSEA